MMTSRKKQLLKQFHTVLSKNGMMKYKASILESAGVDSSKDLSENDLIAFINNLNGDADMWRKRVMASVGGWLNAMRIPNNPNNIKGIATRASGYKTFNEIPISRLRDIYYEFSKKGKAAENSQLLKQSITDALTFSN